MERNRRQPRRRRKQKRKLRPLQCSVRWFVSSAQLFLFTDVSHVYEEIIARCLVLSLTMFLFVSYSCICVPLRRRAANCMSTWRQCAKSRCTCERAARGSHEHWDLECCAVCISIDFRERLVGKSSTLEATNCERVELLTDRSARCETRSLT